MDFTCTYAGLAFIDGETDTESDSSYRGEVVKSWESWGILRDPESRQARKGRHSRPSSQPGAGALLGKLSATDDVNRMPETESVTGTMTISHAAV